MTATGSALSVKFTVNGPNVHNGWAWFYDGSGSYTGTFA